MRSVSDDRNTKARIRDAAIECFAADGVAGTSIRTIAERAAVSPGLVMHHFGSKDELQSACDRFVASVVREMKSQAMSAGAALDPVAALRSSAEGPPLLRYLARTLVDGSDHVDELVDELVNDAVGYIEAGVEAGLIRPGQHPRERAIVLALWSLGAVVLHSHVERLLGVDITTDLSDDPERAMPYVLGAYDLLGGFVTETAKEIMTGAFASEEETA